jgi:hypothetical protein
MAQNDHKQTFETTLHDVIYSVDSGTGLKILRTTIVVMLVLILLFIYTATQFRGLANAEAMEYAQLGRNMSIKKGMITKSVTPLSIWKMENRDYDQSKNLHEYQDLTHAPAYPALLATSFNLLTMAGLDIFEVNTEGNITTMPAEQWSIIPINHFFTLMTGLLLFLLAKRIFTRNIGLLGVAIFFTSDIIWKDSISGTNLSMAAFFVTASFYAMILAMLRHRDSPQKKRMILPFFISVLCAAIAFLTRYITIAAIPGILLFAWLMAGKFRGGTRFVLIFSLLYILLIAPWIYRNIKVSGAPLGLAPQTALMDSSAYPNHTLNRELHPEFKAARSINLLKQKWNTTFTKKHPALILSMGGGVIMALFLTTFFYSFVRPQVNYLRWGVGLSLLLTTILAGFFSESSLRVIHTFWPFAILYSLAFFHVLLDRLDFPNPAYLTTLKTLFIILAAIPLILTLLPPRAKTPNPPYWPPMISELSKTLTEREILCTDMPWATAWYGNRTSILLPKTPEDFINITDNKKYISAIYITAITQNKPFASSLRTGHEKEWFPIITGRIPQGFPLDKFFQVSADQIFVSDRKRWENIFKTKTTE